MFGFLKNKFLSRTSIQVTVAEYVRGAVTDRDTLEAYATDASVFKIVPEKVFYPTSAEDIVSLIQECKKNREEGGTTSITVRAGGTCMTGGPLTDSWVIDMTRHMHDISIDPVSKTATVQMGAYFRDIEDEAFKYGLMYPSYPSSHRLCGIGGMIGNNASGEKSLRFGPTSENVVSLTVALPSGEVILVQPKEVDQIKTEREGEVLALYKRFGNALNEASGEVKKVASGYRLGKVVQSRTFSEIPLFVGSQGTLGIVIEATLKLAPIPKHCSLLIISAQKLSDLADIISVIQKHNPEGLETFDDNTFKKAEEHMSEYALKALTYIDRASHLFILAQFSEDTFAETNIQAHLCFKKLSEKGYFVKEVQEPNDVAALWEIRRHAYTLLREYAGEGFRAVPCIEDVIVPLRNLGTFIEKLTEILVRRSIPYGFHGHIGDGSLRIIPILNFKSETIEEDIIELTREVFVLVKKMKGNMSADHSDGIIRSPFLKEFYGEELYEVFEMIKKIYDPENILNPRKKVGSSFSFLRASLDKPKGSI